MVIAEVQSVGTFKLAKGRRPRKPLTGAAWASTRHPRLAPIGRCVAKRIASQRWSQVITEEKGHDHKYKPHDRMDTLAGNKGSRNHLVLIMGSDGALYLAGFTEVILGGIPAAAAMPSRPDTTPI